MNEPYLGRHVAHVRDGPTGTLRRIVSTSGILLYNNYQSTINMAPFDFLYGKPCQMPLSWNQVEDKVLVGL
jgi:hypothetical protein